MMEVYQHFLASVITTAGILFLLPGTGILQLAVLGTLGMGAGVLIDLDHFLLARRRTGNWSSLKEAFRCPVKTMTAAGNVFDDGLADEINRLITHGFILVLAVASAAIVNWKLSIVITGNIAVHILLDLYATFIRNS